VRAYNEGVRWQIFAQAASRIMPAEREAFLDEREQLEKELRVDDFEVTRLKLLGSDHKRARVQVDWSWHMDNEGIVKSTTTRQSWKLMGKRWILLEEVHLRGDEMPGVAPAPTAEDDEGLAGDGEKSVESGSSESVSAALQPVEKTHKVAE
jgi:hypothetical protein